MGVLAVFAVINGIGCGSFFSLFPTVLGSVYGAENTLGVLPIMWSGWFFGFIFVSSQPIKLRTVSLISHRELLLHRSSIHLQVTERTRRHIGQQRFTRVQCLLLAL